MTMFHILLGFKIARYFICTFHLSSTVSTSVSQSQVSTLATGAGEDAVVLDIAAKFVQDIIDRARTEAATKLNQETLVTLGWWQSRVNSIS